jgi:formiminoglutamase
LRLPLLLSVPHAGLTIPPEAEPYCVLTPEEIAEDGDEGAREIYTLEEEVLGFVTTEIARAIVDMNRSEGDRRRDGVVKTHTCWNVPVYRDFPPDDVIESLLERYHRPYHRALRESVNPDVLLGIDCHTMAAAGPPVGPDPGKERPAVCLGNADGTCPADWLDSLGDCLASAFGLEVSKNRPFKGGHIVRSRPGGIPWVLLELSRGDFMSGEEKRACVLEGLRKWCRSAHV